MSIYKPLMIVAVVPELTTAPPARYSAPPQSVGYNVALRLSRVASEDEARMIVAAIGDIGFRDTPPVSASVAEDILTVKNTTIEFLAERFHRHLREVVAAADKATQDSLALAAREAERVAVHQQHVREVAAQLQW